MALDGIAVDAHLRSSAADVFAAGDVAAYVSELHGRRVRIEHWDVARAHGEHLANEIMGSQTKPFTNLPYFFATLGDWAFLEYAGLGGGRAVFRGGTTDEDMSAAFLGADDALTGLICVGRPDDLAAARELVLRRARMRPSPLANAATPLLDCVRDVPAVVA